MAANPHFTYIPGFSVGPMLETTTSSLTATTTKKKKTWLCNDDEEEEDVVVQRRRRRRRRGCYRCGPGPGSTGSQPGSALREPGRHLRVSHEPERVATVGGRRQHRERRSGFRWWDCWRKPTVEMRRRRWWQRRRKRERKVEWKEKGGVEGERTTVFIYVFNFFYLIKINKLIFLI